MGAFVPDGPVIVSLDAGYETDAIAVYERDGEVTRMQMKGDAGEATVVIRDPQTKYVVADTVEDTVRNLADSLEVQDLTQERGDTVDEPTERRLEALGYR